MKHDVRNESSKETLGTTPPSSNPPDDAVVLDSDEELARLREELASVTADLARRDAEIAALTSSRASQTVAPHRRVRKTSAGILITLTCFLSAVGLIAVWTSTTVLNTDRYVTTVAPLATDPAIQSTAADRITNQLFSQVDVQGEIKAALPPNAQALAAPLTSQIKGFVENQVVNVMGTPAFSRVWQQANRVTQTQIAGLLLNKGGDRVIVNSNGTVNLDLHALVTAVLAQLESAGVTLFDGVPTDKVQGSVELFKSSELAHASRAAETLNAVRYIAPALLIVAIGGALALSTNRRKATAWIGVALVGGMLIDAALLAVGSHYVTSHAESQVGLPADTASAIFNTLTRFLSRSIGVGVVLGLVVFLAAGLTGNGRVARWFKFATSSRATRVAALGVAQGRRSKEVSVWVAGNVAMVRAFTIVVAALVFWLWSSPTITVLIVLVLLTLLVLFAVEVLRAAAQMETSASGSRDDTVDIRY